MTQEIQQFVRSLNASDGDVSPQPAQAAALIEAAGRLDQEDFAEVLEGLRNAPPPQPGGAFEQVCEAIFRQLHQGVLSGEVECDAAIRAAAVGLYEHVGPEAAPRWRLLTALAAARDAESLSQFARLMSEDPPLESLDAGAAFAPLFQQADYDWTALFPQLLGALAHPQAAPAVLDLANYLVRSGRAKKHPAAAEAPRLIALLKGVCARLSELERYKIESPAELTQSQRRISDSVAIASSLCDALGLIGDAQAKTAVRDALQLQHRRIRVEAAAALARLGEEEGAAALTQMAEYPISRLRAVAYAQELGLQERLDPRWTTPAARAEAELACYLAEPNQLGAPPSEMELLDQRRLAWPGYEDQQDCYLFRFTYRLGDASYTNVGVAGPLTHAVQVDLTQLPHDDIYAFFAGWQTEHPDIHEIPAEKFNEAHQVIAQKIVRRLQSEGFEVAKVVALGVFFGERAIVAAARRGAAADAGKPSEGREQVGAIVAGMDDAAWFPHEGTSQRPLGPDEAWCIWKGRRLLSAFN